MNGSEVGLFLSGEDMISLGEERVWKAYSNLGEDWWEKTHEAESFLLDAYRWKRWVSWCLRPQDIPVDLYRRPPKLGDERMCYFFSAADALGVYPVRRLFRGAWRSSPRLKFIWTLMYASDFQDVYTGIYPMHLERYPTREFWRFRPHFTLFASLYLLRRYLPLSGPFRSKMYDGAELRRKWKNRPNFEEALLRALLRMDWVCLSVDLDGGDFDPSRLPYLFRYPSVQAVCVGIGGEVGHAYTLRRLEGGWEKVDGCPSEPTSVQYLCIWRLNSENQSLN